MSEPSWLAKARTYLGLREIHGPKNSPIILKFWREIRAAFTNDETPWCAGFVGACLEEAGITSSRAAYARSYLKWGQKLPGAAVGAICVLERGPVNGHVFFVVGRNAAGQVVGLGGNQGDMVKIEPFALARVLGWRWPVGQPLPVTGFGNLPLVGVGGAVSTGEA